MPISAMEGLPGVALRALGRGRVKRASLRRGLPNQPMGWASSTETRRPNAFTTPSAPSDAATCLTVTSTLRGADTAALVAAFSATIASDALGTWPIAAATAVKPRTIPAAWASWIREG